MLSEAHRQSYRDWSFGKVDVVGLRCLLLNSSLSKN
jgi:hypothetical protein